MGGLTLDFGPMLPVVIHDRRHSGKMVVCFFLGGSDGAPLGPGVLIWSPWSGMGMGLVGGWFDFGF